MRLMMYAAALAHREHGDPMDTDVAEVTAEPDRISLRLALGGVFAMFRGDGVRFVCSMATTNTHATLGAQ